MGASSVTCLHLALVFLALCSLLRTATCGPGQCKLNFEEYQNRRRSAIQAQILSKLGLTAPPTDIGPEEVPEDVLAMYNETVRILEERRQMMEAVCQEAKSEEYFAKVPIVYHLDRREYSDNYQTMRHKLSKFFRFDLSSYAAEVHSEEVFEAEMRLYQVPNEMMDKEQHIDVYQLIPARQNANDPGRKHLYSTVLSTTAEGWIKIDVTEAVRDWVSDPDSNLGVEVTTPCQESIHVLFADPRGTMPSVEMTQLRGDQQMGDKTPPDQHPRLIVLAPANDTIGSNGASGHRRRRSTSTYGQNTCADQSQPSCCLRQFYVNFKRHLGWGWIRQPKGYYPNYCAGSCSYVNGSVWSAQTHHASVLETYRRLNPDASPSPCCSPRSFKPLHILFYDKGRPLFRELPNAIVTSCECS